jgi:ribulose-phosphate 3-epimerase
MMSLEKKIIPAVIAQNQDELDKLIEKVADLVDVIQLDIMDGKFVQNKSIDFDFKLPVTNCKFEAHLMVNDPEIWINEHASKVDTILVHYESITDPMTVIYQVKDKNKKFGFVLNPETPISKIENYLDYLDQVLIMTVNPGFYGSPFLPDMLEKIFELRKIKPELNIEVDGGITPETVNEVYKAGANMFVSGSYIVKSENVNEVINKLKSLIE